MVDFIVAIVNDRTGWAAICTAATPDPPWASSPIVDGNPAGLLDPWVLGAPLAKKGASGYSLTTYHSLFADAPEVLTVCDVELVWNGLL